MYYNYLESFGYTQDDILRIAYLRYLSIYVTISNLRGTAQKLIGVLI